MNVTKYANSKFIVNRNNLCYIYVEKRFVDNEPMYYIYYDKESTVLSFDHFQSIYGNDEKMSIEDFLVFVQTSIVSTTDIKYDLLYHEASKLLNEVSVKKRKSPLLWGHTYEFSNLLDAFNDYIYNFAKEKGNILDEDNEINYEEEYQRLIKQEL